MSKSKLDTFGPYTPIRQAGDYYFISGQVGVHQGTGRAHQSVVEQAVQVLDNLKYVLKTKDLDLKDVVKTTIYLTDINDFTSVNEVYSSVFKSIKPARSTVEVSSLPSVAGDTKLLIEIDAIAYKKDGH